MNSEEYIANRTRRLQYERACEDCERRHARNKKFLEDFEKFEKHAAMLSSRTSRLLKIYEDHERYFKRVYPVWYQRFKSRAIKIEMTKQRETLSSWMRTKESPRNQAIYSPPNSDAYRNVFNPDGSYNLAALRRDSMGAEQLVSQSHDMISDQPIQPLHVDTPGGEDRLTSPKHVTYDLAENIPQVSDNIADVVLRKESLSPPSTALVDMHCEPATALSMSENIITEPISERRPVQQKTIILPVLGTKHIESDSEAELEEEHCEINEELPNYDHDIEFPISNSPSQETNPADQAPIETATAGDNSARSTVEDPDLSPPSTKRSQEESQPLNQQSLNLDEPNLDLDPKQPVGLIQSINSPSDSEDEFEPLADFQAKDNLNLSTSIGSGTVQSLDSSAEKTNVDDAYKALLGNVGNSAGNQAVSADYDDDDDDDDSFYN